MNEKSAAEWPLLAFTLGIQVASGLALAALTGQWLPGADSSRVRLIGVLVFPLAVVATAASVPHLGRLSRSWRVLANLRRSRLSREILVTAMFLGTALVSSAAWLAGAGASRGMSVVVALLGLMAVLCGGRVYSVPARPVWNSWWLPASFLGSAVLAWGAALTLAAVSAGTPLLLVAGAATVAGAFLQITSALGLRAACSRVSRQWQRDTGAPNAPVSAETRSFAAHLTLAGLVPLVLGALLWTARPTAPAVTEWLALALALSAAAGLIVGRRLMFVLGASEPRY